MSLTESVDFVALATKSKWPRKEYKKYDPRKGHCDHCNLDGHTRESCFKIVGYRDWFKNKNRLRNSSSQSRFARQSQTSGLAVNNVIAKTPLDIDPLPNAHKAYSMALSVETQKEVQMSLTESVDFVALATKSKWARKEYKKYDPCKGHCDHCNLDGHTRENCFKIVGYPDWFKNKNRLRNSSSQSRFAGQSQTSGLAVNNVIAETPLDVGVDSETSKYEELNTKLG
ncbi:hypothetical protein GH714_005656 [Hevea brasiliensis]|uniref:Uncharacterized protein n=1 Tax=Hevea brasiliensis TaxID=3981 RepID=A0A6A6LZC8_HEVBR|nr:hypothetical protein GH714_005656 [Hevea brasiliensis]